MIDTVRLTRGEWERLLETAVETARQWDTGACRTSPETGEPEDKKSFVSGHLSSQIMLFQLVRPMREGAPDLIEAHRDITRQIDQTLLGAGIDS